MSDICNSYAKNTAKTSANDIWTKCTSSMATKNAAKLRIDHFFKNQRNRFPQEEKEWERMKQNFGRTRLTEILELGIDKLKINSMRRTRNFQLVTNEHKVEFSSLTRTNKTITPIEVPAEEWQIVGEKSPKKPSHTTSSCKDFNSEARGFLQGTIRKHRTRVSYRRTV